MKEYLIRRLLLIPLTLVGITVLVFAVIRLAPGGPVEQGLATLMGGEGKRNRAEAGFSLTASQVLELEEKFRRDKSTVRSYLEWLGVMPKDRDTEKVGREFAEGQTTVKIPVPSSTDEVEVKLAETAKGATATMEGELGRQLHEKGWKLRLRTPEEQKKRWEKWMKGVKTPEKLSYRVILYRSSYDGLLQGSLGRSEKYGDLVWGMIVERLPVSIYFGLVSMVAIYGVCLPLGILKAIRHRSWLDNVTSLMVFAGYAIPGYALGSILMVYLCAQLGWFPLRGFTSDGFEDMSLPGKVADILHHTALPLICYLVSSFAMMTMMMKNNLMDQLAADYVRTAVAKGVSFPRAVFGHAFRNSMVPIATTVGGVVSSIVAGSILIEKIFDINGFGLLQLSSILDRDEQVIMGVVFFSALLMLIGNVVSDLCVALVDRRVSFQ